MSAAPARVLGIHALVGPFDPWVPDGISLRVLMNPRLGIPLGPLAVTVMELGEQPNPEEVGFFGSGRGWQGGGSVDGVAWLRLAVPAWEQPPVMVQLHGEFDDAARLSVVRRVGDPGPGITAIAGSTDPRVLSAPDVRTILVEGQCRIERVVVWRPQESLVGEVAEPLGLPLGVVAPNPNLPLYLGDDDDRAKAVRRVRDGAPLMHAPHEPPTPDAVLADPDLARLVELDRIEHLVLDAERGESLAQRLEAVVLTPHEARGDPAAVTDLIADSPQHTQGTLRTLEGLLAAAGEPGIARWLGLATLLPQPSGSTRTVAISVAGRWILPTTRWSEWVRVFDDESTAGTALAGAGLNAQLEPPFDGLTSVYLWAQARVDLSARTESPGPPAISGWPPGSWMTHEGSDVVRLPLTVRGLVPAAQVGIVRLGADDPVPIQPPIPGLPERTRPLLMADGSGVDLVVPDPPSDGAVAFRGWQADMFGRWSEATPDVVVQGPARPTLPVPEVRWFHDPTEEAPAGEAPFLPKILVRVGVPPRNPGEPGITAVTVALDDDSHTVAPSVPGVEVALTGDPLGRAETKTQRLVATFSGSDGSEVSCHPIEVDLADPRPPLPPPRPQILLFADPPDASGISSYQVPLPAGPGIDGWRIFVTTESRLLSNAATDGLTPPDASLSRNDRAVDWVAQAARMRRERFDAATPVAISGPTPFHGSLPGSLREVVFVRAVPQRRGAEPPFGSCPVLAFAVPFAVIPAAPDLRLDRSVTPPVMRVQARPGVVDAVRYRLRLAPSLLGDPRAAVVLIDGDLTDGVAAVPVPALRPFASAYAIAEVLARSEAGAPPVPATWSAPSLPVQVLHIPGEPPALGGTPTAEADGANLHVSVPLPAIAAAPQPGPFHVWLFSNAGAGASWTRVADVAVAGTAPVVVTTPLQPGAAYRVVLVDPIGRTSAPVAVPPA